MAQGIKSVFRGTARGAKIGAVAGACGGFLLMNGVLLYDLLTGGARALNGGAVVVAWLFGELVYGIPSMTFGGMTGAFLGAIVGTLFPVRRSGRATPEPERLSSPLRDATIESPGASRSPALGSIASARLTPYDAALRLSSQNRATPRLYSGKAESERSLSSRSRRVASYRVLIPLAEALANSKLDQLEEENEQTTYSGGGIAARVVRRTRFHEGLPRWPST
jgi:hypothetical protein